MPHLNTLPQIIRAIEKLQEEVAELKAKLVKPEPEPVPQRGRPRTRMVEGYEPE